MNNNCTPKLNVRKTGKTRQIYSRRFLFRELYSAAQKENNEDFVRFQFDCMNDFIIDFNLYCFSVTIDSYDLQDNFINFEFNTFYHQDLNFDGFMNALNLYGKRTHTSRVVRRNLANPGCTVFNSDIMPLSNWLDTEFYYYLKKPAGLHHLAQILYSLPNMPSRRLRFAYHSSLEKIFGSQVSADEVEFFSLPFFLAWTYRSRQIDAETLYRWFELLVGMTPKRLALLRQMVNIGRYQSAAVAARLHVSDRVVRNYIAEAYGAVEHLLPAPEFARANTSPCVDLVRYYDFLKLVGSGGVGTNRELAANPSIKLIR